MPYAHSSSVRAKRLKRCSLRQIRQQYQRDRVTRGAKRMSIEDICSKLDISSSTLAGYEQGDRLPNALVCSDMCMFFGTTINDIYPRSN